MRLAYDDLSSLKYATPPAAFQSKISKLREIYKDGISQLKKEKSRDDYLELLQLATLYLSSDEDEIRETFKFRRPGALHKARWMSKLLYCLKIHLLTDQIHTLLPKGAVFSAKQDEKISKFVEFSVYCYIPWWVRCRNAASAPLNDLKLIKAFSLYKTVEEGVAEAATKAFSNHLWYLTEEMTPLAFFSTHVSIEEKKRMVLALLEKEKKICSKRYGAGFQKPRFPDIGDGPLELSHFIGEDSWSFFSITRIGYEFLNVPVEQWESDCEYNQGKDIVDNFLVVNDAAERAVKLTQDVISKAKKEETLQDNVQVIENIRNMVPEARVPNRGQTTRYFKTLATL